MLSIVVKQLTKEKKMKNLKLIITASLASIFSCGTVLASNPITINLLVHNQSGKSVTCNMTYAVDAKDVNYVIAKGASKYLRSNTTQIGKNNGETVINCKPTDGSQAGNVQINYGVWNKGPGTNPLVYITYHGVQDAKINFRYPVRDSGTTSATNPMNNELTLVSYGS